MYNIRNICIWLYNLFGSDSLHVNFVNSSSLHQISEQNRLRRVPRHPTFQVFLRNNGERKDSKGGQQTASNSFILRIYNSQCWLIIYSSNLQNNYIKILIDIHIMMSNIFLVTNISAFLIWIATNVNTAWTSGTLLVEKSPFLNQ